jgi:hypothetical protein
LVQLGRNDPQVIDDDDGSAKAHRQMGEQPYVGVQTSGRTADANNGKTPGRPANRHPGQPEDSRNGAGYNRRRNP